jgi:hypothetical protein
MSDASIMITAFAVAICDRIAYSRSGIVTLNKQGRKPKSVGL